MFCGSIAVLYKAGTDGKVTRPRSQRRDQRFQRANVVLSVPVKLDRNIIIFAFRVQIPRLDRAADP